ncbi:hypothetical protein H4J02_06230 [Protaetiibacter sp. SSC-01]|uniref:hypothetical protein n=1 Tax=Protaetiibacter sp. SSC-01 TaxID=2759943 RepID=UPI00165705FA|nr:hypothetical protein [Protaetiibacter sp. SSC-01]QNO38593.1 hypothetical protein H4J02_06230 [Protaetiibacter sp. SSC-01]
MTDAAPAPAASAPVVEQTGPVAPRRRRPGPGWFIAGGVVLALAAGALVAIPLGGWDTVELETAAVPELPAGDIYEGRHYSVRLDEAWVGDVMPDEYDVPEEGMTFVVVRAMLRNEWREPDAAGTRLLSFAALEELPNVDRRADIRVASDGVYSGVLPPGVDMEVLMFWEVPVGSVRAGEPIAFGVTDGRPDEAVLYSGTAWRDEHTAVQTTLVPRPSGELEYPWER